MGSVEDAARAPRSIVCSESNTSWGAEVTGGTSCYWNGKNPPPGAHGQGGGGAPAHGVPPSAGGGNVQGLAAGSLEGTRREWKAGGIGRVVGSARAARSAPFYL